jgi:hypothetical protein
MFKNLDESERELAIAFIGIVVLTTLTMGGFILGFIHGWGV